MAPQPLSVCSADVQINLIHNIQTSINREFVNKTAEFGYFIHFPLFFSRKTIHYSTIHCPGCMLRSPFLHGADTISAWRKKHLCTAQEIFLHGAMMRFPSYEQHIPMLLTAHSHATNCSFPRWEWPAYMVKVRCFHSESTLFFHSRKHFSSNYPLNFN